MPDAPAPLLGGAARWSLLRARRLQQQPVPRRRAPTNTLYNSFTSARRATSTRRRRTGINETPYTYQIYEPLYGYHYLKRPYELVPEDRGARSPSRCYLDKDGQRLPDDAPPEQIAESVYDIPIKPRHPVPAASGVRARTSKGRYRYHALKPGELGDAPLAAGDFEQQGTRELVADDFVYAIKRHATTRIDDAGRRHLRRVRARPEGVRRADQGRGREAARRARPGDVRDKPFLDFRQLAARGRERARNAPAAHPHQGQVPAVELLDGDDLHRADAVGGRRLLRAAGHGRQRPVAEPVAGRHRAVHDDRVRAGPPARDEAQPELPRRAVSLRRRAERRKAAGCSPTAARRMPFVDTLCPRSRRRRCRARRSSSQGYLDVPEIERTE